MLAEPSEGTFARSANASLMWDARGRWATAMSADAETRGRYQERRWLQNFKS